MSIFQSRIKKAVKVTFIRIKKFGFREGSKILTFKPHSAGQGKRSPRNTQAKVIVRTRTNPIAAQLKNVNSLTPLVLKAVANKIFKMKAKARQERTKRYRAHLKSLGLTERQNLGDQ